MPAVAKLLRIRVGRAVLRQLNTAASTWPRHANTRTTAAQICVTLVAVCLCVVLTSVRARVVVCVSVRMCALASNQQCKHTREEIVNTLVWAPVHVPAYVCIFV